MIMGSFSLILGFLRRLVVAPFLRVFELAVGKPTDEANILNVCLVTEAASPLDVRKKAHSYCHCYQLSS